MFVKIAWAQSNETAAFFSGIPISIFVMMNPPA